MIHSNRMPWTGLYSLLLAVHLGAVLMDQSYAGALRGQSRDLYGNATAGAADMLLLFLLPVLLAGAISLGTSGGRSRLLVVGSLAAFSLNLVLPVLASLAPHGMAVLEQTGPLLRVAVQLGALLLAVLAVREVTR